MKDIRYECMDKDCNTYLFQYGRSVMLDGIRCPRCNGPVVPVPMDKLDKASLPIQKQEPLLKIELQDLKSVPKVTYKGEEISALMDLNLNWTTKTDMPGTTQLKIKNGNYVDLEKNIINERTIIHDVIRP